MRLGIRQTIRIDREKLFFIAVILEVLVMLTTSLLLSSVASLLFITEFFVVLGMWLIEGKRKYHLITISIAFLSLTNVLFNALLCNSTIDFEYLKKWMMFCNTIFFFDASLNFDISISIKKRVYKIFLFLALWFVFYYNVLLRVFDQLAAQNKNYLTFGMTNPNLTAIFLFCLFIIVFTKIQNTNKIAYKICYLFLSINIIYFIIKTKSRNVFLGLAIFLIFAILVMKNNAFVRSVHTKKMFFIAIFAPLLFLCIYLFVYDLPFINEIFSFFIDTGKELDSRSVVWSNAVSHFFKSPFIGAYSQISGGTGISQMHNSHLDILASYGIVTFLLMIKFLYNILANKSMNCLTKEDNLLFIGYICILFLGFGEAAIFSGGLGVSIFAGVPLYMIGKRKNLDLRTI